MTVLVTGAAGFIGYHTALALLDRGEHVIGVDNLNDYYDPTLKEARLSRLERRSGFKFERLDIADREAVEDLVRRHAGIDRVINLAAQAGVRYSLTNPYAYLHSNINGHVVLLEACRNLGRLEHFVYASSSSVYGANTAMPFAVGDRVDTPVSLYGATKKATEEISYAYAHLYRIPLTGLRFFTVYGPWGRPDMAAFIFTRKILAGEAIPIFNHGDLRRDFTYVDDIVDGVLASLDHVPDGDGAAPPFRIYNLGNHRSERLMDFVAILEAALGVEAKKDMLPMQTGDVKETFADIEATQRDLGFEPKTTIAEGVPRFVTWYREFYGA